MKEKLEGTRLRIPPRSPPMRPPWSSCRADWRTPVAGRAASQEIRGVTTSKLQLFISADRSELTRSIDMLNAPLLSVVALASTLPPQRTCTVASAVPVVMIMLRSSNYVVTYIYVVSFYVRFAIVLYVNFIRSK